MVEEADAGVAGAGAGAGQAERQRDVGLAGLAGRVWAVRVTGSAILTRRAIEAAWAGKPSACAIGTPARRQRGRRVVEPDLGHPAPEVAHVEAGGEARGALGGQRVVRTRDVVAERGAGGVADEQAARASGRAARAPPPPRPRAAGARAPAPRRRPARPPCRRRAPSRRASQGVEDRLVVADRDGQRALAVLGLRLQVERERLDVGAVRRRSRSGRTGPAKPSIPTTPDTCRLASCTHRLPGPTITSTARDRLGAVGERGDRLRAGDREHARRPRTAAPRRGSSGAARRPRRPRRRPPRAR